MKKTLIVSLLAISLASLTSATLAESVIVKETTTWKSVPINVDPNAHTYTVVGTVPGDTPNYYYTYSGYRCFSQKRDVAGIDAVIFRASVSGGNDIYCYKI